MFRFIKKIFVALRFGGSLATKCISLNNQFCQVKSTPTLIGVNSNGIFFYPFVVSINKRGEICNKIDDLHAQICVPYEVKNMNVKIFNVKDK